MDEHVLGIRKSLKQLAQIGRKERSAGNKNGPVWLKAWAEANRQNDDINGAGGEENALAAPPLVEEMLKYAMKTSSPAELQDYPMQVTSELIARVKALPQLPNKAFIVTRDKNEANLEDISRAGVPLGSLYFVFTVDMERYHEKTQGEAADDVPGSSNLPIFNLRHCPGFPINEMNHTKRLINSFATSCLQSPLLFEDTAQHEDESRSSGPTAYRPSLVLFETKDDAEHPQVQLFLTMMGMESKNIQAMTDEMKTMLEDSMDKSANDDDRVFPRSEFPNLNDMCRGIMCGNCRKTGPKLLKCACGKAYYCNKECQRIVWEEHKQKHNQIMLTKKKTTRSGNAKPSAA
jgi:MYND finger